MVRFNQACLSFVSVSEGFNLDSYTVNVICVLKTLMASLRALTSSPRYRGINPAFGVDRQTLLDSLKSASLSSALGHLW